MARLTNAAAGMADAAVSPLMAAVGAALGCAPAIIEEIDGLPAADRAALAMWTARDPSTAAAAVRARLILPAPGAASADAQARKAAAAAQTARPGLAGLVERLTRPGAPAAIAMR